MATADNPSGTTSDDLAELGARARADSIARASHPETPQRPRQRTRAWKPVGRFLLFTLGGFLVGAWAGSVIAPLGLEVSRRNTEKRIGEREFIVRTWGIQLTTEVHVGRAGEIDDLEQALRTKWERWLVPLGLFFGSLLGLAVGTAAVLGLEIVTIRARLAALERGRLKSGASDFASPS